MSKTDVCLNAQVSDVARSSSLGSVSLDIWHQRFGHLGIQNLKKLISDNLVRELNCNTRTLSFCEPCVQGHAAQQPYPKQAKWRASEPLELLHSDVCGLIETESLGKRKYFVTFVDDCTRFIWVHFIRQKSEVFKTFCTLLAEIERGTGKKLKVLRSDRGGEYMSSEFKKFLKNRRIRHELSTTESPQQNGVSERMNCTLVEKACAMLKVADLPNQFWAEVIANATYIRNQSPTTTLKDKVPYEAWWGSKPMVKFLRTFGCNAYALILKGQR